MRGIAFHWTGGGPNANPSDLKAYHFLVQQDGMIIPGIHKPEDNLIISDGVYARHTKGANAGRIGVAMCGMMMAKERPFFAGPRPITPTQVEVMIGLLADLCIRYHIHVTRQTVLSHAEVQPTLGIPQAGKWDVMWLPGMTAAGDPVAIGDGIRAKVLREIEEI